MDDPFALAGLLASIASLILVSRITVGRATVDEIGDLRREVAELKKDVIECKAREQHYIAQEARFQREIQRLMRHALNIEQEEEP